MVNTLTTDPIICNATGLLKTGPGVVKSIQFIIATDSDSTLLLTDSIAASGTKKLIQLETTAEQHTVIFTPTTPIHFTNGLYCETIDAGEALIQT